jgi:hypothetical protein
LAIIEPKIIAPDSSHWAKWIDATISDDNARRAQALGLHERLLDLGRIPLLSWHHLEELLGVEDDQTARSRVAFIQSLPLIAWMRLPHEEAGCQIRARPRTSSLGSIIQVLAAEAIAASESCHDLVSIRDRARQLMLRTGPGSNAIGSESWVYDAMRPLLRARQPQIDMVAALSPLRAFDESRTIGELARRSVNSPDEMRAQLRVIYDKALQEATNSTGGDAHRAKTMADQFITRAIDHLPTPGTTVRDLLVSTLVSQGLDAEEVRDECVLGDLSELGLFRSHLRVVASETGRSFDDLKGVSMAVLPSRVIGDALRKHGQHRKKRPGSDLNDAYLGVLAAYCDVLYVDKRTAEDFRRAIAKEPKLIGLIGDVAKAADFTDLLVLLRHERIWTAVWRCIV